MDDSVLRAIQAAVEADVENVALRLHYAQLLVGAGNAEQALSEAATVLARQPDNLDALKVAADSADLLGDKIRAHSYRNLLNALSWNSAKGLIESAIPDKPIPVEPEATPDPDPFTDFDDDEEEPQRLRVSNDDAPAPPGQWETERPEVTLADVAGMEQVKKRLTTSFLAPMRNPDLRKLYGKSLKGGLLLYGPPGCGKTFIARAIAGELSARFISIGITDVMDMWIGNSEKNLHEFFESARRNKPCVVFIDELDALGRKRSLMRHSAGTTLINALLAELDGVQYNNEGIYVLAATNHPWDVDAALRRPGRLDRMILVLPPDEPARKSIVVGSMKERPVKDLDPAWIASKTEDFSGADMVHLCDSASELALEDSIEKGVTRPVMMGDFKQAMREVKPSTRNWFETAKNHAIYANEGGIYDDLMEYLRKRRMI